MTHRRYLKVLDYYLSKGGQRSRTVPTFLVWAAGGLWCLFTKLRHCRKRDGVMVVEMIDLLWDLIRFQFGSWF